MPEALQDKDHQTDDERSEAQKQNPDGFRFE
jgi:hypothetical protein